MSNHGQPLEFNFHNIVTVQIHTQSQVVSRFFMDEYGYHLAEEIDEGLPTVNLNFEFSPGWIACPPGFKRHLHKGLAHWVYRIEISDEVIQIDVKGNRWAIPMVHHMLVHPSLRFLANKYGVLMLHAGAVVNSGYSLVFTGHGGAGKTTTTSLVLASGGTEWSIHADDYVFLAPDSTSLAYITRSHLYKDLLRWVPDVQSRLTPPERLRLEGFGRLRSWSGERIKWPVRLPAERLWPGYHLTRQAKLAALIILQQDLVSEPQLVRLQPDQVPVKDLIEMNFGEARHYRNLLEKSNARLDVEGLFDDWQSNELKLLTQRIKETPVYLLKRPPVGSESSDFRRSFVSQVADLIPHVEIDDEQ